MASWRWRHHPRSPPLIGWSMIPTIFIHKTRPCCLLMKHNGDIHTIDTVFCRNLVEERYFECLLQGLFDVNVVDEFENVLEIFYEYRNQRYLSCLSLLWWACELYFSISFWGSPTMSKHTTVHCPPKRAADGRQFKKLGRHQGRL